MEVIDLAQTQPQDRRDAAVSVEQTSLGKGRGVWSSPIVQICKDAAAGTHPRLRRPGAQDRKRKAAALETIDVEELTQAETEAVVLDLTEDAEDVEGAMHRKDAAGGAAGAAKALAEKAELLKRIAELEQRAGALHPTRVPFPEHWQPSLESSLVEFVQLPQPQGCPGGGQQPAGPLVADPQLVQDIMHQGISRKDAEAALRHTKNRGDDAMLWILACQPKGGAAAVERAELKKAKVKPKTEEQLAQERRQQQAAQEAEEAVALFDRTGGGQCRRAHVQRVFRIQHSRLWSKYCARRRELEEDTGLQNGNEMLLFHGAGHSVLTAIMKEGFDFRLSNMGCAMGQGTYFAGHSSYSIAYCMKGVAPGQLTGLPQGGAGGAGILPGVLGLAMSSAAQALQGMPMWGPAGAPAPQAAAFKKRWRRGRSQPKVEAPRETAAAGPKDGSSHLTEVEFGSGELGVLVCRVALGRTTVGAANLRRPPEGFDAVASSNSAQPMPRSVVDQSTFCVFDNAQAYPQYLLAFNMSLR